MKELRVLIVDNSNDSAALLVSQLSGEGYDVQSEVAKTAAEMKAALGEREWDIILSDYMMPDFTALEALAILKESGRNVPFIILSETKEVDLAVEAMRCGANDYLIKDDLVRLGPAIEREMADVSRRCAERQAEESRSVIDESKHFSSSIVEYSKDSIITVDRDGTITSWNKAAELLYGYSIGEAVGKPLSMLTLPRNLGQILDNIHKITQGQSVATFETERIGKGGRHLFLEITMSPVKDDAGKLIGISTIARDITQRNRLLEERIKLINELDSQKARLHHIFEHIPAFIVVLRGPEHVFEMANPAYYPIVDNREVIGLPLREALPELEGQGYFELIGNIYQTGEVFVGNEMPVDLISPESNTQKKRYLNLMYMPLREADNSISGVLSYGVDVTEQVISRVKIQESEERYRIVAETANDVIITIDEHSSILFANSATEKTLGFKPEELVGRHLSVIVPERFREAHNLGLNRYLQTGRKTKSWSGLELQVLHRDGSEKQVEISFNEFKEDDRHLFTAVIRDITERKRAQQILLESEEKYRSIVETANEGIWLTDLEDRITYVNQQMADMLGYSVDEMMGCPVYDFFFEEDIPTAEHKYAQRKNGEAKAGEFRLRRKDGSEIITLFNTSPRRDPDGEIVGILSMRVDITERKRAESALREAEGRYRRLIESSPGIIYLNEPTPPYSTVYVSPSVEILGYSPAEWYATPGMWASLLHKDDRERVLAEFNNATEHDLETGLEYRIVGRDGTVYWWEDRGHFVSDAEGNRLGWQGIIIDITKTKALEEQLRQSQKLESIGLLAGGIAHDFNNMLTAINGHSDLALRKMTTDDPLRRHIEEIKKAAERSAGLTYQLLAFSRKQVLQSVVLDINGVITETTKMLERVIGEDVELITSLNSKAGRVKADPGQLSQILINLALNARDAMPRGGLLTVETAGVFLDSESAREQSDILPGDYVLLTVSDTGSGIKPEIKDRIFEPFFTTKETGKGTGLGLATVYGIVKQSGGSIEVFSEESEGTTFKIYLPRVAEQAEKIEVKVASSELPRGTETILIVEDEEMVRRLAKQVFEECGYTVVEARNGLEALEIYEKGDHKFDLLMTDVVMPEMGGSELSEILMNKAPGLKILFTSGYTDSAVVRSEFMGEGANFIQKPFSPETLATKVRKICDDSLITKPD